VGYAPLDYVQIDAWRRLLDIQLRPWEATMLIAMDAELRRVKEDSGPPSSPTGETVSSRPLSAPLFDALFG